MKGNRPQTAYCLSRQHPEAAKPRPIEQTLPPRAAQTPIAIQPRRPGA